MARAVGEIGDVTPGGTRRWGERKPAEQLERRLRGAAARGGERLRGQVRGALVELLRLAEQEPEVRALLDGGRGNGEAAGREREEAMERLTACLEERVARRPATERPHSPLAAAAAVGGIERVLQARLGEYGAGDAQGLLSALLYVAVQALEGPAAAREAQAESDGRAPREGSSA